MGTADVIRALPREELAAYIARAYNARNMVVLASGLGMLPIALSRGIGSESRAGIGIASVGGIIVAGILTLTALPMIYTLFTGRPKATNSQPLPPPKA